MQGDGVSIENDAMYVCRVCGRKFYTINPSSWTYRKQDNRNHVIWFCGWNCMRAYEKTHPPKLKSAKKW